jgi:hypothetical protein
MPTTQTSSPTHCLECNATLSPAEAQGLCARCLLKMGLADQLGQPSIADAATRKLVPPPLFPFDFGGYHVTRLLGRGGMGAVYEAEHRESGRRVALKVLGHTIDSPEMRKRFLREGRLAAAVNHPNSVYIFGTEEIDATPVIAMELVAGGTLKDEMKRRGPLPFREAVDAILQVISGLEAAQSGGVLHRDVKPANCFIAPDGTVKVGDFGLSVSTVATHDSQLTASGMMLGTPSFAPPEQLRGDDLDVRADIYSVGATLYALLTGHAPFEGDNAIQVVAAVLDKAVRPIADFRPDVPSALAQLIGKCLAKKRDDRFPTYTTLRDALAPFSSQATEAAPPGLRTVAGMIDLLLATMGGSIFGFLLTGGRIDFENIDQHFLDTPTLSAAVPYFGVIFFAVTYFAVPETLWGASLGKFLCGLRVVGPGRSALQFGRAVGRAFVVVFAIYLSGFIEMALQYSAAIRASIGRSEWAFSGLVGPSFILLLFLTMRRRNGFAGVHDLLTGTRVITRPKASDRPRLATPVIAIVEPAENALRIGPYRVIAPMGGDWVSAFDDVLRRQVWIRKTDAAAPALSPARRDLGRATRLRWLAGARGSSGWDAFDAPAGHPLAKLTAQPWSAVRCWLLDLAEEIGAAQDEQTLPAKIGLDHVFVTSDGHAVLLDEPWRGASGTDSHPITDSASTQQFLLAVAEATLDRGRVPLHAREFLEKLRRSAFDRLSFIAGNLRSLLARPAEITRGRRLASAALVPALALVGIIPMVIFIQLAMKQKAAIWAQRPGMEKLELALNQHNADEMRFAAAVLRLNESKRQEQSAQLAKYISGHWGAFIESPQFEHDPIVRSWPYQTRDAAREIARQQPPPPAEELKRIDAIIDPIIERQVPEMNKAASSVAVGFVILIPTFLCVSQFASLLCFGATLGQRLFGFAVVNLRGELAGRARMLWRWAIAWIPAIAVSVFLMRLTDDPHNHDMKVFGVLDLLLWLACLAAAALPAQRGWHDRLAGTRLISR